MKDAETQANPSLLAPHYEAVRNRIKTVKFNDLWEGFKPYPFALYNDAYVHMENRTFPKTDAFMANTAIEFEGQLIAIWKLDSAMDADLLTAKLIHEMFHAYQYSQEETRFANEFEAVTKIDYAADYLNIKMAENRLLSDLSIVFSQPKWERFKRLRHHRQTHYPYASEYEAKIEVIEGTAQYVELNVLKQLNQTLFRATMEKIRSRVINPDCFIPTRILSYDVGALLLCVMVANGISFNPTIAKHVHTYQNQLLANYIPSPQKVRVEDTMTETVCKDTETLQALIERALKTPKKTYKGVFKLLGFNVYNARFFAGFLYSTYFIMVEDKGKQVVLQGNFLARLDGETIREIIEV